MRIYTVIIDERAEPLFQVLVIILSLTIGLREIRCRQLQLGAKDKIQLIPESRDKLGP